MLGAYLYLTARTFYNRIVRQIGRIRNPRYAIAIVLGAFYIWFFLIAPRDWAGGSGPLAHITGDVARNVITVGTFLLFAASWVLGRRIDALAFTPAEVHFLLPAPITRRGLVIFKLLRLQLATLVSTVIWVVLIRRGSGDLSPLMRAFGLYAFFATLSLHRLGAALFHASVMQHGSSGVRRQKTATAVAFAILGVVFVTGYLAWQTVTQAQGTPATVVQTLSAALDQPLLAILLYPFAMLSMPAFASSTAAWMSAFPIAVLILAAHFAWVVTANSAFEEAAVEASAKAAKRIADFKARGVRSAPPTSARMVRTMRLPMSAVGAPSFAIIWKNGLAFLREMRGTTVFVVVLLGSLIMGAVFVTSDTDASQLIVLTTMAMLTFWSVILGPRFVRNDLRADMAQLSLLKTYPLSGSSIVTAEVASATISLTVMQMCMIVVAYGSTFFGDTGKLGTLDRTLMLLAAPLCLLAVNSVNLAIQNGASLLFPAWMSVGLNRPTGVEALGQNLLLAFASLVLLAITLVPPAAVAVVVSLFTDALPLRPRLAVVLLAALVVLAVELVLLMKMLGRLFDRTDPGSMS